MKSNDIIYLNNNLELVSEMPEKLMAEVKVRCSEYFGNYHTSYFPISKDGSELIFNGWHLNEFYINRQWNKSFLLKFIVSKKDMPYIDLYGLIRKYRDTNWYNRGKSELELNSMMFRFAIEFLENIPEEISTLVGIDMYLTFTKVSTNQNLYDFYIMFSDSFQKLTATEIKFLNKLFIQRWKAII